MTLDGRTDERPYRCGNRSCGRELTGTTIPKGWLGLRQYPGDREIRPNNLGVYCSLSCLLDVVTDMAARAEVSA